MKRTLIAAAAMTLAAGAAQAQLTIYGLIDLSYGQSIYSDYIGEDADFHSGGDNGSSEGNSTTRIGLKGTMDVGSGYKANFNLETGGIDSDGGVNGGGNFFNRQMWAGLSAGWGEVRLGRQDSVVYQVMNGYDFNGASNGVSSGGYSSSAVWLPGRQSRLLNYISPNLGGFKLQAGWVPKGNEVGAKDTVAGAVTYAAGGLSVSLAGETKRFETTDDFVSVAGSYDFKVVKVMAGYADGGNDIGGYSLGIVAPVAGFNFGAMYAQNNDTDTQAYELFVNKEVFKNTYFYAEYGDSDKTTATSIKGSGYAIGMIFTF
jgi:predicted porin